MGGILLKSIWLCVNWSELAGDRDRLILFDVTGCAKAWELYAIESAKEFKLNFDVNAVL